MFIAPRRCTACGESGGHTSECSFVRGMLQSQQQAACDHSKHHRIHSLEERDEGVPPAYVGCAGCRARLDPYGAAVQSG